MSEPVKSKRRRKRKKAESKLIKCNWKELQSGDIIKVPIGYGPYYVDRLTNEKINLNYFGYFKVYKLFDNAVGAYPYNNKKFHGFCTIYMGKNMISNETNIHREPHKILKLVKNV